MATSASPMVVCHGRARSFAHGVTGGAGQRVERLRSDLACLVNLTRHLGASGRRPQRLS